MSRHFGWMVWLAVAAVVLTVSLPAGAQEERDLFEVAPLTVSLGLGEINFEGDEKVQDGIFLSLKVGYDLNARWTVEGDFNLAPSLDPTEYAATDPRHESEFEDSVYAARLGVDILFHLRNTKNMRFDPFLAAGGALTFYEKDPGEGKTDPALLLGGGLFYHFNDSWAVRGDIRTAVVGGDTEFNSIYSVSVVYRPGAEVEPAYQLSGGDLDSDGDGLLDTEEAEIGTNPYDPDTDKDGLSDGEEVKVHKTDPLNPDTDWDGLKDGPEVLMYNTNPLDRDTDDGGVADGHEVIEDNTDPLNPADDLQLFTLNIEFDYDKSNLRPEYYDELDVIVKVLQRDPGAEATIEGHADKRKSSKYDYNMRLSERRARAVMDYLVQVGGISPARLEAKGYGYTRPVVPNDTEENMQKNRRTEIYIRPSNEKEGAGAAAPAGVEAAPDLMEEDLGGEEAFPVK